MVVFGFVAVGLIAYGVFCVVQSIVRGILTPPVPARQGMPIHAGPLAAAQTVHYPPSSVFMLFYWIAGVLVSILLANFIMQILVNAMGIDLPCAWMWREQLLAFPFYSPSGEMFDKLLNNDAMPTPALLVLFFTFGLGFWAQRSPGRTFCKKMSALEGGVEYRARFSPAWFLAGLSLVVFSVIPVFMPSRSVGGPMTVSSIVRSNVTYRFTSNVNIELENGLFHLHPQSNNVEFIVRPCADGEQPRLTIQYQSTDKDDHTAAFRFFNRVLYLDRSLGKIKLLSITASLPEGSSVDLKSVTKKIKISGFNNLGDVRAESSTGDITLTDVLSAGKVTFVTKSGNQDVIRLNACGELNCTSSTGDLRFSEVRGVRSLTAANKSGDIDVEKGNAIALSLDTSTGDVSLDEWKSDVVSLRTVTGDVELESCELQKGTIVTVTGDINTHQSALHAVTVSTSK